MEVTKFCTGCGNGLIETAAICPKCGTPVAAAKVVGAVAPKTKNAAVLLAVFLGFGTYLYTFAKDKSKFWIFLAANSIASIITFTALNSAFTEATNHAECILGSWNFLGEPNYDTSMCDIYQPDYTGVFIGLAIQLGIYVFIIVDRAQKPQEFYSNYPN
jgi:uncharacterized OB-fold protein